MEKVISAACASFALLQVDFGLTGEWTLAALKTIGRRYNFGRFLLVLKYL